VIPCGILTISDRASLGVYEDKSGPAIQQLFTRWIASPWEAVTRLVPDEQPLIEAAIRELADERGCALIVTTGGTGPSPRDVTPEATVAVCDRLLPGFGEQMRAVSVRTVPTAILSRQVAGTRGSSLIINLPGKPAAIEATRPLKDSTPPLNSVRRFCKLPTVFANDSSLAANTVVTSAMSL
jgi:molybdopterin adenylyltransferase